ncbi:hypothetical protein EON64_11555 [archaeon]|nr:MAG: hypothetical protein EON64_11555 [archaeon]
MLWILVCVLAYGLVILTPYPTTPSIRYGITEMKHYVLQMLAPSASNYLDLLRVSDLLSLPTLRTQVLYFLVENFAILEEGYEVGEGDGEGNATVHRTDILVKAIGPEDPSYYLDVAVTAPTAGLNARDTQ